MQTVNQGSGALPRIAAERPAAEHETLRIVVASEDVVRRPAALPRSPSNPESAAEAAAVVDDADEVLVEDVRAGVSPAEMVELKLRALLRTRGVSTDRSGTTPPGRGPLARG